MPGSLRVLRRTTSSSVMPPAAFMLDSPFSLAGMMDSPQLAFHQDPMISAPSPLPQVRRAERGGVAG
jgi:hypothetical protein